MSLFKQKRVAARKRYWAGITLDECGWEFKFGKTKAAFTYDPGERYSLKDLNHDVNYMMNSRYKPGL